MRSRVQRERKMINLEAGQKVTLEFEGGHVVPGSVDHKGALALGEGYSFRVGRGGRSRMWVYSANMKVERTVKGRIYISVTDGR